MGCCGSRERDDQENGARGRLSQPLLADSAIGSLNGSLNADAVPSPVSSGSRHDTPGAPRARKHTGAEGRDGGAEEQKQQQKKAKKKKNKEEPKQKRWHTCSQCGVITHYGAKPLGRCPLCCVGHCQYCGAQLREPDAQVCGECGRSQFMVLPVVWQCARTTGGARTAAAAAASTAGPAAARGGGGGGSDSSSFSDSDSDGDGGGDGGGDSGGAGGDDGQGGVGGSSAQVQAGEGDGDGDGDGGGDGDKVGE